MLFAKLYQKDIFGVLSGLDRIRFRGTDCMLSNSSGFSLMLNQIGVLLKDFGQWTGKTTKRLRDCCNKQAEALDIPIEYLDRSGVDKDQKAHSIAEDRGIAQDGSICMFSVVEGCRAPTVTPNRQSKKLEVRMLQRKCVFIYYYFDHPQVGFGHVRLQTWAPYTVHICLNGRHWLEKQLIANSIGYQKSDNCFVWLEDIEAAQELMNKQLETKWSELLDSLVFKMCPVLPELCAPFDFQYYWSADQTEFATDVMFRSKARLDALFDRFVKHGMISSDSNGVLRFLGKPVRRFGAGRPPREIKSECRRRPEGVCIKHWINANLIKMYSKQGTVLRTETTINNPRDFKSFRPANDDTSKPCTWQKMRKGTKDLYRRCEISRQSNERYLDAMAALEVDKTLQEVAKDVCNRTTRNGRAVRGLNPWNKVDYQLFTFLAKGEWAINGFRNRNLCQWLIPEANTLSKDDRKKLSAKATRLIGMLRAHGLISKVAKENRYILTKKGQRFVKALLVASDIEIKRLTEMAA